MPHIVIDQVAVNQWTGTAWSISARVQAQTAGQHVAYFSAESASLAPLTLNPAILAAAIAAIEAQGSGEVGPLDTKTIVGAASTISL